MSRDSSDDANMQHAIVRPASPSFDGDELGRKRPMCVMSDSNSEDDAHPLTQSSFVRFDLTKF